MSFQATKTVSDIADDVKRTFGDESGVQVTDPDILRWVNQAQVEIVSKNQVLPSVASISAVAAQYEYSLNGLNIQVINSIQYNGAKLKGVSFTDFEDKYLADDPTRSASGIPEIWARWGNTITLYPTPAQGSDVIKMYFYALPAPVTGLTDTLGLPDNYYSRILEYVMAQAYEMDENFAAADNKLNRFDSNLVGMAGDEDKPRQDTYSTITIRPEDM